MQSCRSQLLQTVPKSVPSQNRNQIVVLASELNRLVLENDAGMGTGAAAKNNSIKERHSRGRLYTDETDQSSGTTKSHDSKKQTILESYERNSD